VRCIGFSGGVHRAGDIHSSRPGFEVESATVRQVPVGVTLAARQLVRVTYGPGAKYLDVGARYEVDANLPGQDGNLASTIANAGGLHAFFLALALIVVAGCTVTVRHRKQRAAQRSITAWKASRLPAEHQSRGTPSP
jgi:hypothetical protein